MLLETLLRCAILAGFTLKAAAGPVPSENGAANLRRQAHAVIDEAEPAYKKSKRVIPDTHVLHERQPSSWARRWEPATRAPSDAILPMRIGLKQRKVDDGHNKLMAISDPNSPEYGKHMTAEEVIAFFAPHRSTVEVVVDWLTSAGIHIDRISQSANRQWIQFDATVSEAEDLLMTDYHVYKHVESGASDLAAENYHVPAHVQEHIDYVTPGIRLRRDVDKFHDLQRRQQIGAEDSRFQLMSPTNTGTTALNGANDYYFDPKDWVNSTTCGGYTTPECVRYQYKIPRGSRATPGNELGIFETIGQHYSKSDLDGYFSVFALDIPNGTYPISRLIDGATADTVVDQAGDEADLDFEAAMPLIYPQKTVLYQVDDERIEVNMTIGGSPYRGFFNTFFDAIDGSYCSFSAFGETGNCVTPDCLDPSYPDNAPGGYKGQLQCGVYKPTNVISISYGGAELALPQNYVERQCIEIMKLGLQGVTVVVSSGDDGVAASGGYCAGDDNQLFLANRDASCPYVLAVGSTELDTTGTQTPGSQPVFTEKATARFGSGGGFSNYFPTPKYQAKAVEHYFNTTSLNFTGYTHLGNGSFSDVGNGVYQIGGRGYPDVSAIGDYFLIFFQGKWVWTGGTSLSAPLWGAMLTLINEERIAYSKRPVGFVNPVLYAHPEVFTDITAGSNPGCGTDGFPAAEGWDPVTGMGTPNYPKLLELLMRMP
ncbi:hypothetical protein SEPCBS119000_004242 [Sporothrix epigloea]|uniref:Peptidase S53 domain-containing protein n=1 Tax=Sporothrix epigloea TaxID=1892477 RepID=A0ABP0DRA2_9PEZI